MRIATLYPTPPYNFPLLLELLARYHVAVDLSRRSFQEYWRTLRFMPSPTSGEGFALVRVVNVGTVDAPQLDVYVMQARGEVDTELALRQLRQILSVEVDKRAFYAYARQDQRLWEIVKPLVGIRDVRSASAFEALSTTIIEQQISLRAAHKALRWLAQWAGDHLAHEGEAFYAFPTAAQIARATIDDLRPLKITFKRMALLIDVAQREACGELRLDELCVQPDAYHALQRIKGIGHWSAALTLMRTRGDGNQVLHNDVALQAAVNTAFFGLSGRATPETVIEVFQAYGQYAGLAAYYTVMRRLLDHF
jgi:DNA-3-methyladenine glycosylase II